MSSLSSLTVRPSGCRRIKLQTVSMARSCSGNLRLYGTIPPHGLPLLYLEGGTLGCGAFSRENHRFKTDAQLDNHDCKPGRQTQTTNVSITIPGKQHSTRIAPYCSKKFAPRRSVGPIAGHQNTAFPMWIPRFCSWLLQNCW